MRVERSPVTAHAGVLDPAPLMRRAMLDHGRQPFRRPQQSAPSGRCLTDRERTNSHDQDHLEVASRRWLAEVLGVQEKMIARWRSGAQLLRWPVADDLARRLGYHPVDIWPEWYQITAGELVAS